MLGIFLSKGVIYHSFSDHSSCVFLDLYSGETLSILMSETEIVKALTGEMKLDKSDVKSLAMSSLMQKNILVPLDNKNH